MDYKTEPKLINVDSKLKERKFNNKNKNYKLTNKGKYSIAAPAEANKISKILLSLFKSRKNLVITDATLGMAGNAMSFSKYFSKVNAFELNKTHYEVAKHNLETFGANNVTMINGDYTKLYKSVTQDIIFIDPPWGGPDYIKKEKLRLELSGINVVDLCNRLKSEAKVIALNVPYNFDFAELITKMNFEKLSIYVIKKNKVLLAVLN